MGYIEFFFKDDEICILREDLVWVKSVITPKGQPLIRVREDIPYMYQRILTFYLKNTGFEILGDHNGFTYYFHPKAKEKNVRRRV